MQIDFSIIIINYNTSQLTFDCIKSIYETTPKDFKFEVIVVDNASKYEDYLELKDEISLFGKENLTLFRSKINSGFASGNMTGVQFASGKYVVFINNDVVLLHDSFSPLIDYFENNIDTGVIGLQPLYDNQKKQVAFGHFDTIYNRFFGYWLFEKLNPSKVKRHKTYFEPVPVDYVVGSFMFFRARSFNEIGGFDTNLFLYFEEMDICKRLKNINLNTIFFPNINYVHINGASTKLGYVKKIELKISHLYIVRKNHGYLHYCALKYFFIIQYFFKALFNPKHFKMLFKLITFGPPLAASIRHLQKIQEK
jgi:GT2 family glycosyltransferase